MTLVGRMEIRIGDRPVPLTSEKSKALLVLLANAPRGVISREAVQATLWANVPEQRAQGSLRTQISRLRATFAANLFGGFVSDRRELKLRLSDVDSDIWQMIRSIDSQHLDRRLFENPDIIYSVCAGMEHISEGFHDEIRRIRTDLAARISRLLEERMDRLRSAPEDLRETADLLLTMDPLNETAVRAAMSARAALGNLSGALAIYQEFWKRIGEEFGEEPSLSTQDLSVQIRQGQNNPPPQAPSPRSSILSPDVAKIEHRPLMLIVTPDADSNSGTVRERSLLTRQLMTAASRFREWRVQSTPALSTGTGTLADYVVALVGEDKDDINELSALCMNGSSGEIIMSRRIREPANGWAASRDHTVREILVNLNAHVTNDRVRTASARRSGHATSAYDRWLQAEEHIRSFKRERWIKAGELLDDLIKDSPEFGRGFASRAGIANMRHLVFPGLERSAARHQRALALAERGVEIDPMDNRTQLALGWSAAMCGRYERAIRSFQLAYEQNEYDPWTMVSAAVGLAFCDEIDEARRMAEIASLLDPEASRARWEYLATIYFLRGDHADCARACALADGVKPNALAWHAIALLHVGEEEAAHAMWQRFLVEIRAAWDGGNGCSVSEAISWLTGSFPIRAQTTLNRLGNGIRVLMGEE